MKNLSFHLFLVYYSCGKFANTSQPTAIPAFVTFVVGYVERDERDDLPFWLIFLLFFILNTVGCVMNAYNNITWECDRLHYEEGFPAMKYTRLAIFGIPSSDRGLFRFD